MNLDHNLLFTEKNYADAYKERANDYENMEKCSYAWKFYVLGVAIECKLREHILRHTSVFNEKHNLVNLLASSEITIGMNDDQKEKLTTAIKIAGHIWDNKLRYTDDHRINNLIVRMNGYDPKTFAETKQKYIYEMEKALNLIKTYEV